MANVQNLIPKATLSKEEAKKLGAKGGKASGKARRERKAMKEQLELLLSLPLKDEQAKEKLKELGFDTNNMDNQMAMIVSTWNKALNGDVKAFEVIRDTVGEKPIDRQEIKAVDTDWFIED